MIIGPVIAFLQQNLPLYTNLFSENIPISSLVNSSGTITATTSEPHGFATGSLILIGGALTPINITSLTYVNNIATAVTETPHDLTEGWYPNVKIIGADNDDFNGTFQYLKVPNRYTFTYQLQSVPTAPAGGNPQLLEFLQRGYNGYFPIVVISDTEFTYTIDTPDVLNGAGTPIAVGNSRISGAATRDRGISAYTKQGTDKMWMIVAPGATNVSNDRNVRTDAKNQQSKSDLYILRTIETMSVYVICPSTGSIAARRERDLIETEVAPALFKVLCGHKFEKPYPVNNWSRLTLTGHDVYEYPNAYYIHQFDFEQESDITFNLLLFPYTVAFRDIDLQFIENEQFNSPVIMTADINLDDVPLE